MERVDTLKREGRARWRRRKSSLAATDRVNAILVRTKALRAHIQNGQIVLDEPVELPEGVAVEVLLPEHHELSREERAQLEIAIEEAAAEFARGEFEDAHAFARRLVAKS